MQLFSFDIQANIFSVNNDFHDSTTIFKVFDGLAVDFDSLEKPFAADTKVNGNHTEEPAVVNGNGAVAVPA